MTPPISLQKLYFCPLPIHVSCLLLLPRYRLWVAESCWSPMHVSTHDSAPNTGKHLEPWKGKPRYCMALKSQISFKVCESFLSSLLGHAKSPERAVPGVRRDEVHTLVPQVTLMCPTNPFGIARHAVFAHCVPAGLGALTKGAGHSPAPWHPGPSQHCSTQALEHRGDVFSSREDSITTSKTSRWQLELYHAAFLSAEAVQNADTCSHGLLCELAEC